MAKQRLLELENTSIKQGLVDQVKAASSIRQDTHAPLALQQSLFATYEPHPAVDMLKSLDPNDMTPKQAHDALYRMRELLK